MTIEVPKAPSCETPQASRGWGLGRGCTPPQSIRGSGERRKLPQRGPGRSPGSLRIFYVSSSILCLKFKFNSQFYIIRGTDKSISLISNQFTGSKSHKAYNTKFVHYKQSLISYKYKNLPLYLIFYTILTNSFVLYHAHLQLSLSNAFPIPFGLKFQTDFNTFKRLFFGMLYHIIFALVLFSNLFSSLTIFSISQAAENSHFSSFSSKSFPPQTYLSGQTDWVVKGLPQSWKAPVQVQRLPTFWPISVDKLL